MAISAKLVKELREKTGAGMMDCKKALTETDGDIDKAQGGIGIVPNIYNDSARYWIDLETRKTGTLEAIIQQIKQRQSRPVQQIQRKDSTKKDKTKWSLEDI